MNQLRGGAGDSAYLEQKVMDLEKIVSSLRSDRDVGVLRYGQPGQGGPIPVGGIIMWSGAIADIPTGWALCDGANGTPDLTDRFVMGAGDTYSPGDTGGAAAFTHNSQGAHDHGGLLNHVDGAVAAHPSHTHGENETEGEVQAGSGASVIVLTGPNTDGPSATLTHNVTQPDPHVINGEGSHTHDAHPLPPYFALAYIMRTG